MKAIEAQAGGDSGRQRRNDILISAAATTGLVTRTLGKGHGYVAKLKGETKGPGDHRKKGAW